MAKKVKDTSEEGIQDYAKSVLNSFLVETKAEHYNYEETIRYKVSSGSLIIDSCLNGGFGPGLIRLIGVNQGGKTPAGFEIARNFLNTVPNSRCIYIKAEGRLSEQTMDRSGLSFVFGSPDNWVNGTCYVHETNVFENILDLIQRLIGNNPDKIKYCFILDSIDGVILRGDKTKALEESNKVAGPQVIAKKFFQQCALPLFKFGHLTIFISQVSANIQIAYSSEPQRQMSATGGNALLHWADYILDFGNQLKDDYILEDDKVKPDRVKNKILGHWCNIEVKKSTNEEKGLKIKYPIKHGRTHGSSIWRSREIVDFLLQESLLIKAGAWLKWEPSICAKLQELVPETKEQYQGLNNVYNYLEENNPASDYFFDLACNYLLTKNEIMGEIKLDE